MEGEERTLLSDKVLEQFKANGVWTGRFPKSQCEWDEEPLIGLEDTASPFEKQKLMEQYIATRLEEHVRGNKLYVKLVEMSEDKDDWEVTVFFEVIKSCL